MDLLFKRYASPFLFVDGMIQTGQFSDFVDEFVHTVNSENEDQINWEFFLHKVNEGSFSDFIDEMKQDKENKEMTANDIESTVQQSMDILNNFNP